MIGTIQRLCERISRRRARRESARRYTAVLTWRAPHDFFAPVVQYVTADSAAQAWGRAYLQTGAVYRPYIADLAAANGETLADTARCLLHPAAMFHGWPRAADQ
jgi:hypothetical protein